MLNWDYYAKVKFLRMQYPENCVNYDTLYHGWLILYL